MADDYAVAGATFRAVDVSGKLYQVVILADDEGAVLLPLTDAELRAADVKVTLDSEAVVLGAGSAAIGKLAANSGVDIGDVDVLSLPDAVAVGKAAADAAASGNPVLIGGRAYATPPSAVSADGDVVHQWLDRLGRTIIGTRATLRTPVNYQVAYSASQTAATVYTPASGKKLCCTHLAISASGAGAVKLFDGSDTAANAWSPNLTLAANGGWDAHFSDENPLVMSAADNLLKYTSGAGAAGSIWLHGWEE